VSSPISVPTNVSDDGVGIAYLSGNTVACVLLLVLWSSRRFYFPNFSSRDSEWLFRQPTFNIPHTSLYKKYFDDALPM